MASMRSDARLNYWLISRNRKRRMEANPQPATIADITWGIAPPSTASTNTDIFVAWDGGLPPYHTVVTGPSGVIIDQVSNVSFIALQFEVAGQYTVAVNDSFGSNVEGTTIIS